MGSYFSRLNYAVGDEDATLEWQLANRLKPASVAFIAGSGSRLLPILSTGARCIYCVDISEPQLDLTRLRLALLQRLDCEGYRAFVGYPGATMEPVGRRACFGRLDLPPAVRLRLRTLLERNHWGPLIGMGEFERMLTRMSAVMRAVLGRGVHDLFACRTLEEQRVYVKSQFPRWRWSFLVHALGNATVLNGILYGGELPKPNIGISTPRYFVRVFASLFDRVLARRSFFLQLLLLGRIGFEEGVPIEAHPEVFQRARQALPAADIRFVEKDLFELQGAISGPLDILMLSDVPSFLAPALGESFPDRVRNTLNAQGTLTWRGSMRVVHPQSAGYEDVSDEFSDLSVSESTQLWTVSVLRRCADVVNA